MRRAVWVAVGAVGGILVYRRAQELFADARDKGVVLSAQQVGMSTASAITAARALAASAAASGRSVDQRSVPARPGSAAARVLRQSQQGE